MTITSMPVLQCNHFHCHRRVLPTNGKMDSGELRVHARNNGWAVNPLGEDKGDDFCPDHREEQESGWSS